MCLDFLFIVCNNKNGDFIKKNKYIFNEYNQENEWVSFRLKNKIEKSEEKLWKKEFLKNMKATP